MKSNNAEDEDQRKNQNNNGVDLQSWALVGVESYLHISIQTPMYAFSVQMYQNPRGSLATQRISITRTQPLHVNERQRPLRHSDTSRMVETRSRIHYITQVNYNVLNMVLLLPPAPAALVLLGRAFASLSFWSAAARLRIAVLGPPGGVGDEGLPMPEAAPGEFTGEEARGEDCRLKNH